MSRSLRLAGYALTAMLLAAYAVVMWWVINPTVPTSYRAYYIDQTTTCMNQPVPGTYTLGTIVSFLPEGGDAATRHGPVTLGAAPVRTGNLAWRQGRPRTDASAGPSSA